MRSMEDESAIVERWRSLSSCYNDVASQLDRELHERHGLTMSEFETLDRLVGAECDRYRMQDLEAVMYLSQSALSRTVARLEKNGLVGRSLCDSDRRGVYVTATEDGVRAHAAARRTHLAILAEHLPAAEV
jgi:DNA-binding MarR family transcriptional regulator